MVLAFSFGTPTPAWSLFIWTITGGELRPGGFVELTYQIPSFDTPKNRVVRGLKSLAVQTKGKTWKETYQFDSVSEESLSGTIRLPLPSIWDSSENIPCTVLLEVKTANPVTVKTPIKNSNGTVTTLETSLEYRDPTYQRVTQDMLLVFFKPEVKNPSGFSFFSPSFIFFLIMVVVGIIYAIDKIKKSKL